MPKRTLFTNITPLPSKVTREVAVAMLHDHDEMIELNPLVIEHHPIKTPRDAPADEFLDCVWQELTDKIHYLPGGVIKGKVSYKACFHDLPRGLQTHIYAPLGLDIREKWSIGGTLSGEPAEARELGIDVPSQGLYLREDGDMRCSRFLTSFVRKNLDHAHKVLVERILKKGQLIERHRETMSHQSYQTSNSHQSYQSTNSTSNPNSVPSNASFQSGSHMAQSRILKSPALHPPQSPNHLQANAPNLMDHPAFRNQTQHGRSFSAQTNSTFDPRFSQSNAYPAPVANVPPTKQFVAELPGSYYHTHTQSSPPIPYEHRHSLATELSSQDVSRSEGRGSESGVSDIPVSPAAANGYKYNPQDFVQDGSGQEQRGGYPEDANGVGKRKDTRVSELPAMDGATMERLR